jgi:hypothetical protein
MPAEWVQEVIPVLEARRNRRKYPHESRRQGCPTPQMISQDMTP